MYKFDEINGFKGELNFKEIIKNLDLEKYDEAIYICNLNKLKEQNELWHKSLPRVKPFYAVKCNDDVHVVQALADLNINFDCASKNEIKLVLGCNVDPERIIFANPCKPISHLEYAKEHGITTSTVDTEFEIYKIHKHYPESNLVIRFRSEAKEAQCPLGDKFGCNADNDSTALILLAKSLHLNVVGVSFHVGSGCRDPQAYERAIAKASSLFKFGKLLGYNMNLLDIGGGFLGDDNEKFKANSELINKTLQRYFKDERIKIIAEPGRFYASSAFTLVCKIHAKREVRGSDGKLQTNMYYINDGVYGSFNCMLYDHQVVTPEHVLDNDSNGTLRTFDSLIWGPTCDALDKIAESVKLPNLACGDCLIFRNMGAYTIPVASPFNGFLIPKVLYFKKIES